MTRFIEPITDRSAADITGLTAKAYFNLVDWARIHSNTQMAKILVDLLLGKSTSLTSLTAPVMTTIPAAGDINTLIANINAVFLECDLPAITGLVELKDDWAAGSSQNAPDYEDVNAWETVINILYNAIGRGADYRVYCGVATVGQARFYQNRWRRYAWVADAVSPVRRARSGIAVCGASLMYNNGFRRYG